MTMSEWHIKNKDKLLQNRKKFIIKRKSRYNSDPLYRERVLNYNRTYYKTETAKAKRRNYLNNKRKNNLNFRIKNCLSNRIRKFINTTKIAGKSTIELLGCDINSFKKYIESKFKPDMNWSNYGKFGWHLDHIKPCAFFDLTDPLQQKICFHYSNIQPLWWYENLSKGDKIV
jgi:hypothetical protein